MAAFSATGFDAQAYFKARPQYPESIFDLIYAFHSQNSGSPARFERALDLGTGPGLLAYPLTLRFKHVVASDPSSSMLAQARSIDPTTALAAMKGQRMPDDHTIQFLNATVENLEGVEDQSVDLVVGAVVAHWFDWFSEPQGRRVWRELERVLRPGGSVAFVGYMVAAAAGLDEFNRYCAESLSQHPDRLGKYYELGNPKAPVQIVRSCYDMIPRPQAPAWDEASTFSLKQDIDPTIFTSTSAPAPAPAWALSALSPHLSALDLSKSSEEIERSGLPTLLRKKGTLGQIAEMIKSSSGYVKLKEDRPSEAEALVGGWMEEARMAQAKSDAARKLDKDADLVSEEEARQCLLPWDHDIDLIYPTNIMFCRRA